jgi:hypothetical protein
MGENRGRGRQDEAVEQAGGEGVASQNARKVPASHHCICNNL